MKLMYITSWPESKEHILHFEDGSTLSWNPESPDILFDPLIGNSVVDGPRYGSFLDWKDQGSGNLK